MSAASRSSVPPRTHGSVFAIRTSITSSSIQLFTLTRTTELVRRRPRGFGGSKDISKPVLVSGTHRNGASRPRVAPVGQIVRFGCEVTRDTTSRLYSDRPYEPPFWPLYHSPAPAA